jgi:hypothetical protein
MALNTASTFCRMGDSRTMASEAARGDHWRDPGKKRSARRKGLQRKRRKGARIRLREARSKLPSGACPQHSHARGGTRIENSCVFSTWRDNMR